MDDVTEITRARTQSDLINTVPVHVVWEITLACDLKCKMCGSRAGTRRRNELTLEECFRVVDRLHELGTREITIIGGEAYLKKGWLDLITHISDKGMLCSMQSGGRHLDEMKLISAQKAGLKGIGISLDGLGETHDHLRGVKGSFERAVKALTFAKSIGMKTTVNSQLSKSTVSEFPALMQALIDSGVGHWQIQLSVAMGNAVNNSEELLNPHEVLDILPMLAGLYRKGVDNGLLMIVGNNIGFFGPYEHLLRGFGDLDQHWGSCGAGTTGMGLEADGTIKGCPSLATGDFGDGNVLTDDIGAIWHKSERIGFARKRTLESLWGYCKHCYYADQCRAGCTWTSHSLFGKTGNNPYCHYRALQLEKNGLRESIEKVEEAPDKPFSIGLFRLVLEKQHSDGWVEIPESKHEQTYAAIGQTPRRKQSKHAHIADTMALCKGCYQYIWSDETECSHCGCDVKAVEEDYQLTAKRISDAIAVIDKAMQKKREHVVQ